MSAAYATACEFADHGYPVFPVNGKMPFPGTHGHLEATVDPDQLVRWHNAHPSAGWAVVCGFGFVVVDVDPRHGGDVQEVIGLGVVGPMVETGQSNGSGRGLHVYCAGSIPGGDTVLDGVEVRGAGQYVVLPGSPHASGVTYRWHGDIRPWTPDAMIPLPTALAPRRREHVAVEEDGRIPRGKRDVTLASLAGAMRGRGMVAEAIRLALIGVNQLQCDPPLPERQVAKIARSASTWERGELPAATPEPAPDWLAGVPMDPAAGRTEPPPVVPGFPYLHPAMVAIMSGPTGAGRSALAQAGAYDAAIAGLRVAYLGGEVTQAEFNDRAADLAELRSDEVTDSLRGELARARWLDLGDVLAIAWKHPAQWIAQAAQAFDVVIVDPLGDALDALGLEDNASDYLKFYRQLVQPLRTAGVAVLILENVGHAEDAQHRPYGQSRKMHKADLLFSCAVVEDPLALRITATKVRATRAAIRKGDTWLFTESTQAIEPQGRQALMAPRRSSFREDVRTARLGALRDALGDEPLSVRSAIEKAGRVHGKLISVGTAQTLLSELKVAGEAEQRTDGWARCSGVQTLKGIEQLNTPAELFASDGEPPVCDSCGSLLVNVAGRWACLARDCEAGER